jgi:iron complex transport system ATP-binding protein
MNQGESNTENYTIELNNLRVGYRSRSFEKSVFGPVNVKINQSEMVGIIGRNGIGKSTLLRTIANLQPQLDGEIFIGGISNRYISLKEMARTVSFVSTEYLHSFQIKVDEIIAMGRFPYTGWLGRLNDADKKAIKQAVSQTGVSHLMDKSLHELSDGERQKVMIARALAQDTPLIILDEPTAYLDLPSRYEILMILHDLTVHNDKTILFSTHDLSIAMDVADKLWLLIENDVYEGAPEDLLINKVFRKLFLNSPAEFDSKTSTFRFKRELKRKVEIRGDKTFRTLTKRAVERIGFLSTDDGSDMAVEIITHDGKPHWHLQFAGENVDFNTIYSLVSHLKHIQ